VKASPRRTFEACGEWVDYVETKVRKEQNHEDQNFSHDEPDKDRKPESHHQNQGAHASGDAYLDDPGCDSPEEETQEKEVGRKTPGQG
jgi:hypothetical protein